MSDLTALALKFACLHKQVTEWVLCGHSPRHEDLADAIVRGMAPCSVELEKAIRSATAGRRAIKLSLRQADQLGQQGAASTDARESLFGELHRPKACL